MVYRFILLVFLTLGLLGSITRSQPTKPKPTNIPPLYQRIQTLTEYLNRLESYGFSGVVLVGNFQSILSIQALGWADRKKNIRVHTNTAFDIGSLTKQFTAAGIMKLNEAQKLKLDDTLEKFFSNVPEDKKTITIHQLLTHTAGFPEAIGDDYEPVTREEFVRRAMQAPLLFKPGSQYHYSNVGYSLLAAIIEIVSRQSYEVYIKERFFRHLHMNDTGYIIPRWRPELLAHGYLGDEDWGTPKDHPWDKRGPYWNLRGNGGILSTALDMYRWSRNLKSDWLLKAAFRDKLFQPYVEEIPGRGSFYGYGWVVLKTPRNTRLYTHNGGNGAFFADLYIYMDEDLILFWATNDAQFGTSEISRDLNKIMFDEKIEMPPPVTTLKDEDLHKYQGTFEVRSGQTVRLYVRNKGLMLGLEPNSINLLERIFPIPAKQLQRIRNQSAEVLKYLVKEDYEKLRTVMGIRSSLPNIETHTRNMWKKLLQEFGNYREGEVASVHQNKKGSIISVLRLYFTKGTPFLVLEWDGNSVVGVNLSKNWSLGPFIPTEERTFTFFRPGQATIHIRFESKQNDQLSLDIGKEKINARKVQIIPTM